MERSDEHDGAADGEHPAGAGQDRHRVRSTSAAPKEAKLVPVKGTGLSGPFIQRPVMTVLLTLSLIVAGIAAYNQLAVNDLPAITDNVSRTDITGRRMNGPESPVPLTGTNLASFGAADVDLTRCRSCPAPAGCSPSAAPSCSSERSIQNRN